MKKNILIFGLVLGAVMCVNIFYTVNLLYTKPDFKGNDVIGYTAMVVVFSLIFFGTRNYRNKQLNGVISFWKAFKTGALIALVGTTIYVVVWLFYYYLFVPDFIDKYISHVLKGVPSTDLAAKTKEMDNFKEMYKSPVFVILITYSEVLPIGLLVAFISSLILRRKPNRVIATTTNPGL